jgi:CO/xanthine dehydrogenase FAD-binding subunit
MPYRAKDAEDLVRGKKIDEKAAAEAGEAAVKELNQ